MTKIHKLCVIHYEKSFSMKCKVYYDTENKIFYYVFYTFVKMIITNLYLARETKIEVINNQVHILF